jgi:hypothetical protein
VRADLNSAPETQPPPDSPLLPVGAPAALQAARGCGLCKLQALCQLLRVRHLRGQQQQQQQQQQQGGCGGVKGGAVVVA